MSGGFNRMGVGHAYAPGAQSEDSITDLTSALNSLEGDLTVVAAVMVVGFLAATFFASYFVGGRAGEAITPSPRDLDRHRFRVDFEERPEVRALLRERLELERRRSQTDD